MSRKLKRIRGSATAGLIVLLWCVIPLGWSLDVQRPGTGWTEAYRSAELVIFTKDVEKGRRIVAIAEVDARPEVVFNVVNDFDHYPEFMPYVIESRVLSRNGDSEVVAYNRIAPPFVAERDYPLKFRMTRGSLANGGVFRSEWTASPEAEPEVEGVVRIRLNDGSWVAEPISGGSRTRLTYTLLTNPGGMIPDFVANMSNTVAIPKLFKAVMKRSVEKAGVGE
ncbi:Polyketide cyclase / dehydrase and lipid transport [Nitrosospira sp. Nsp14]|uniref:SRPBCC family protein n=1 Tax=Nitrosospira sp. Nsp14 TaxID=1855333 RepID=UPI0008E4A2D3|nr:SRPBCC family protein [Nitrosospira sp. Nsp14]SFH14514.1 Polyketide cyclase / dehydrase and lipid transport [Nitrosospira sp. Nsp14]